MAMIRSARLFFSASGAVQRFPLHRDIGVRAMLNIVTDILRQGLQREEGVHRRADIIVQLGDVSYPTFQILHRI